MQYTSYYIWVDIANTIYIQLVVVRYLAIYSYRYDDTLYGRLGKVIAIVGDMSSNQPCRLSSLKRQECHMNYGIQNEEWYVDLSMQFNTMLMIDVYQTYSNISHLFTLLSVREELIEKKCFAELLCKREATKFYHSAIRKQTSATCSHLVEVFAFPENELMLPDIIEKSDRKHCRSVVHELAKCLSKHRVGEKR